MTVDWVNTELCPAVHPIGWPRPRDAARDLPVPYNVSRHDDGRVEWGAVNNLRNNLCVLDRRCQVCGDELDDLAALIAHPGGTYAIDYAPLHPNRCLPLTMRHCPGLREAATKDRLGVWVVPTDTLVHSFGAGWNAIKVPDQPPTFWWRLP